MGVEAEFLVKVRGGGGVRDANFYTHFLCFFVMSISLAKLLNINIQVLVTCKAYDYDLKFFIFFF